MPSAPGAQSTAIERREACRGGAGLACVAVGGFAASLGLLVVAVAVSPESRAGLRLLLSPVCHQSPERCLEVLGHPMALCARCAGLYLGLAVGHLAFACRSVSEEWARRGLWLALGLLAVDVLSERAGLRGDWPGVRVATGMMLGVFCSWFTLRGLLQLLSERIEKRKRYE